MHASARQELPHAMVGRNVILLLLKQQTGGVGVSRHWEQYVTVATSQMVWTAWNGFFVYP